MMSCVEGMICVEMAQRDWKLEPSLPRQVRIEIKYIDKKSSKLQHKMTEESKDRFYLFLISKSTFELYVLPSHNLVTKCIYFGYLAAVALSKRKSHIVVVSSLFRYKMWNLLFDKSRKYFVRLTVNIIWPLESSLYAESSLKLKWMSGCYVLIMYSSLWHFSSGTFITSTIIYCYRISQDDFFQ